jgi:hypothetical protein
LFPEFVRDEGDRAPTRLCSILRIAFSDLKDAARKNVSTWLAEPGRRLQDLGELDQPLSSFERTNGLELANAPKDRESRWGLRRKISFTNRMLMRPIYAKSQFAERAVMDDPFWRKAAVHQNKASQYTTHFA